MGSCFGNESYVQLHKYPYLKCAQQYRQNLRKIVRPPPRPTGQSAYNYGCTHLMKATG